MVKIGRRLKYLYAYILPWVALILMGLFVVAGFKSEGAPSWVSSIEDNGQHETHISITRFVFEYSEPHNLAFYGSIDGIYMILAVIAAIGLFSPISLAPIPRWIRILFFFAFMAIPGSMASEKKLQIKGDTVYATTKRLWGLYFTETQRQKQDVTAIELVKGKRTYTLNLVGKEGLSHTIISGGDSYKDDLLELCDFTSQKLQVPCTHE